MQLWCCCLGTLLFDGHPGRPEQSVAFAQAGCGGRLEAYPTSCLQYLGREVRAMAKPLLQSIIAAIAETES